ncbi:MAG TPA: polysaccharide biosynthesis C-terminal domain-containing protein, partial [Patescibacteria group bacterium]|nr:polysaccharide biosynthesis C-terminal domain-containing protein [Patescibacteria group bacterium]
EISRALLKKIWPVAVAVIFNAFYLQGDRVILPLYVSETEVGLYGAAYRVLDIVAQISAMAMGIMLPLIAYSWSRQEHSEFKKRAQMGFELVALILLPLVTGAIVLAKPIMLFVAGEEFASAGPILALLILAALGITLGMVFGHISLAINKQRQVLWVYISDAILSVAGYFFFIPRFGLYGAVYVTVFSEFYAGFMLLIMSSYYSRFFPGLTNFFKIILASLVMGFVIYLLPPLHIIPSILIGGIIYALLIFILRVVSKQTILEILRPRRNIVVENKENW